MRRMFSEKQLENISLETTKNAIESGEINLYDELKDSFVHKIPAPQSTTLTDEEVEEIKLGVFIEGTIAGFNNPILLPSGESENSYYGMLLYGNGIASYYINKATKGFNIYSASQGRNNLNSVSTINGKTLPQYPSNTGTFVLKCIDGTLTWVEEE